MTGRPAVVLLDELLATSDVITLHMPLTPSTRSMIGARELALMKRSAFVINTARQELVDELVGRQAVAADGVGRPRVAKPALSVEHEHVRRLRKRGDA